MLNCFFLLVDVTISNLSSEPQRRHHAHTYIYSTKLVWLKTWQFKLWTHGTRDHLSSKTLMYCKCLVWETSQLLFLFLADTEQPAPSKMEDDNIAKSTVEMEGKIWCSSILIWLGVWLVDYASTKFSCLVWCIRTPVEWIRPVSVVFVVRCLSN